MPEGRQNKNVDLMRYADLGIRLAVTAGLFIFLGYQADKWLGTSPWMILLGALVGFAGGMYSVVKAVDSLGSAGKPPAGDEDTDERP